MPIINLSYKINAPIEVCFGLSLSIDLHKESTAHTNEKAIAGVTEGLIKMGEEVTWQATHFGIRQKLTTKITAYDAPFHFRDEQQKGIFKYFIHDHYFETVGEYVIMKDRFEFKAPLGFLGNIAEVLVLNNYLKKLLIIRNDMIKKYAESYEWKKFLI